MASKESKENSESTGPVASHVDQVADELRSLAGLRSRSAIRDRSFPKLSELLPAESRNDPERRYAALQQLIEAGLAAMSDGDHRQAATALLHYGSGRWRPLTKRGSEAAAAFGLGWDAYRRRRESTGSSLVMETLTELAGVLISSTETAPVPAGPTTGDAAAVAPVHLAPEPNEQTAPASTPLAQEPRSQRTAVLVAGTAVVIAVAAGVFFFSVEDRTTHEAAAEPTNCGNLTHAAGDHVEGADDELTRWSEEFASASREIPDNGGACAGMMSQRNGVVYQEVSAGISSGVSALMVAADGSGEVVTLDHFEFFQYRAEAWDSELPPPGIGVPIRRLDRDDGLRVVEMTNGVLVQEGPELPAVAVVGGIWQRWLDEGGFDGELGTPVSNVYDLPGVGRVQEFTDSNLQVDYGSGAIVVAHPTAADLELPDGYAGALLVSRGTKTAWFVDDDGVRHWLPTNSDFGCVELFHNAEQMSDIPNAAISRLPAGEAFRCR